MVHFDYLSEHIILVRYFDEGESYEERSSYRAVATIVLKNPHPVVVGFCGSCTRRMYREFESKLHSLGVDKYSIERHGEWQIRTTTPL